MLIKYVLKYSLKCLVISEESNKFQGSMKKREREEREKEGKRKEGRLYMKKKGLYMKKRL